MATPEKLTGKLTGKQLRHLRSLAHALKPIVQVGKQGFTDAVAGQIDSALTDHELIKIRVNSECPMKVKELGAKASEAASAHLAQTIGLIAVLYRAHPKKPEIKLPKGK